MPSPATEGARQDLGPIDRGYARLLEGDPRLALCWAGAASDQDRASAVALLLLGQSLLALGHRDLGILALRTSAGLASESGRLPVAIVCCHQLCSHGEDCSTLLDELAATYCEGSSRLLDHGGSPPRLPGLSGPPSVVEPWPQGTPDDALLRRAREAIGSAAKALDDDRAAGQKQVPRQGLLSRLDREGLRGMLEVLELALAPAGGTIIEQGTAGAEAFILARGEVEVWRRPRQPISSSPVVLARLGSGALFGEMALLSGALRAAMVTAARPSILLVARKQLLDDLVGRAPDVGAQFAKFCHGRMVENLVSTSPLLKAVAATERPRIIQRFQTRTFEQGEALIAQGEEPEGLHLIASGQVVVVRREDDDDEGTIVAELGVGDVVGEVSLVLRRPAGADVVAVMPTVTLHLPREQFLDMIRQHPALLSELYSLAVQRDEENTSIVARPTIELDEFVLV